MRQMANKEMKKLSPRPRSPRKHGRADQKHVIVPRRTAGGVESSGAATACKGFMPDAAPPVILSAPAVKYINKSYSYGRRTASRVPSGTTDFRSLLCRYARKACKDHWRLTLK